jgi:hypothetical protein
VMCARSPCVLPNHQFTHTMHTMIEICDGDVRGSAAYAHYRFAPGIGHCYGIGFAVDYLPFCIYPRTNFFKIKISKPSNHF